MPEVTVSYEAVGPGVVPLDSFSGANDDDRLSAAMSYAGAQTVPPFIGLGARDHLFRQPVQMYDEFRLKGCNPERSSYNNSICMAKINIGGDQNWLNVPSSDVHNSQIDNVFFWNTDQATNWMNGPGTLRYCGMHALQFAGFDCVIGEPDNHLAATELSCTGFFSFGQFKRSAICTGGADSISLFPDGVGVWTGQGLSSYVPQLSFSNLGKATFGPMFMTVNAGIGGMRVDHCTSFNVQNCVMEGLNTASPTDGALVKVGDRSQVSLSGNSFGNAMNDPAAAGDQAIVEIFDNCEVDMSGNQFFLAPGQSPTVPCVRVTGGSTLYIRGTLRTVSYGNVQWGSQKPVVQHDGSSTVVSDGSVEVQAI